eukprot:TRINITY_DN2658_c0_g1_i2.p1 TRINITY_DN2658_c0_g1~~TRINITY_DN2658_c0_g1_i2.p1  ORF type:complete len:255 (+),score=59.52 TRINITY_DN2658_c0_g1_i2:105-869(+)
MSTSLERLSSWPVRKERQRLAAAAATERIEEQLISLHSKVDMLTKKVEGIMTTLEAEAIRTVLKLDDAVAMRVKRVLSDLSKERMSMPTPPGLDHRPKEPDPEESPRKCLVFDMAVGDAEPDGDDETFPAEYEAPLDFESSKEDSASHHALADEGSSDVAEFQDISDGPAACESEHDEPEEVVPEWDKVLITKMKELSEAATLSSELACMARKEAKEARIVSDKVCQQASALGDDMQTKPPAKNTKKKGRRHGS